MATKPHRPDRDIQSADGKITPGFNTWFTWLERTVLGSPSGQLQDFADDTAAAAGGIPLYGYYANGGIVRQRIV